jgi:DUF1680 family protein
MPASPAYVVDASRSPHANLRPEPQNAVRLTDAFWQPRREANRTVTLPSQFRHIEETGRLDNFRRASGRKQIEKFEGIFFNDSDIYKWLEAAASALADGVDDADLAAMVETAVDEVEAAQEADGYLNTYFTFDKAGERWTNLKDMHELYCAGHLFQAAVAHYRATGSERLLNVARRFADHIVRLFGPEGKPGACGHEEAELALVELFRATGERSYLEQAARFIAARGRKPSAVYGPGGLNGAYHQDHVPYTELGEVTGHAVRMMYLAAGAADVFLENGDPALMEAMRRQWENMTGRRMYVSGGLGARWEGEAFGKDYELPNARAYAETCAAIGSVMWNWRLLLATGDAAYADLIEHTLYNAVLPGVSLDGQAYFYQNPLEDDGRHRRQPWFGCACCPPNVARLLAQLPGYFFATDGDDTAYVHLYAANEATLTLGDGRPVRLSVDTRYPWDGAVTVTVDAAGGFALRLRVPAWAEGATLAVNGEAQPAPAPGTYAEVRRRWTPGDVVTLTLPMTARYVVAHPYVGEDAGRVAVLRGPLLYCAEGADHPGVDVRDMVLPASPDALTPATADGLPGDVVALRGLATVAPPDAGWEGHLYRTVGSSNDTAGTPTTATLVPYYAWANRAPGGMRVWLRR